MVSRRHVIAGAFAGSVAVVAPPIVSAEVARAEGRVAEVGITPRDASMDVGSIEIPLSYSRGERENMEVWLSQQVSVAQAAAERGHEYTFVLPWERPPGLNRIDRDVRISPSEHRALYGSDFADEGYDWLRAGIVGRMVHEAGRDSSN
jgi:hypothetical protein